MPQIASWLIWNKAGIGRHIAGVRRAGVTWWYGDVHWKGLGRHDLQLPGVLPRLSAGSWREALGSVGIRPTIKVTVFDLNVLEAR